MGGGIPSEPHRIYSRGLVSSVYTFTCRWWCINHISFLNISFFILLRKLVKPDCGVQCLCSTRIPLDYFLKILFDVSLPTPNFCMFLLPTAKQRTALVLLKPILPTNGTELPGKSCLPWKGIANVWRQWACGSLNPYLQSEFWD